ncbi:FAD/NAD-P-binding domain-containing protein, partial [Rickenella mellea]
GRKMIQKVCVIGSGPVGLITAHTLLKDNFDVQIISRDSSVGGVWSSERVYPGLMINNVYGTFSFSALPMAPPKDSEGTGGRLTGEDMRVYMETYADKFLSGRIQYNTDVRHLHREDDGKWILKTVDLKTQFEKDLIYDKVVLCTGGCSMPNIPPAISPSAAAEAGFRGLVIHTANFRQHLEDILQRVKPKSETEPGDVVVIGGGRSAQDVASHLAIENRKVTIVFEIADAFMAARKPVPDMVRKSRFLSFFSPHMVLRTRLERFLHTTRIGNMITRFLWRNLASSSFEAFDIPKDSPLRNTHSLFWGVRTNDEGIGRPHGHNFHALVNSGRIDVVAPARMSHYGADGHSVVLEDGRILKADVVLLATGYASSWDAFLDDKEKEDIGIACSVPPPDKPMDNEWSHYLTLRDPPPPRGGHAGADVKESLSPSSLYRGLVPAKTIFRRDFAVNGASITTNNAYSWEVCAHWISSYFLNDRFLKLPSSAEEALAHSARHAAWIRKRYPGMLKWMSESHSSEIAFWSWAQAADELLEDMSVPIMRTGGNWLTFPFKVVSTAEIENLGAERASNREVMEK